MTAEEPVQHWPGYTDEAHPDVFTTMPAQPSTLKPGQISADKARQLFDEVRLSVACLDVRSPDVMQGRCCSPPTAYGTVHWKQPFILYVTLVFLIWFILCFLQKHTNCNFWFNWTNFPHQPSCFWQIAIEWTFVTAAWTKHWKDQKWWILYNTY